MGSLARLWHTTTNRYVRTGLPAESSKPRSRAKADPKACNSLFPFAIRESSARSQLAVSCMKCLLKYDGIIAAAALLLWVTIVVVEVRFKEFWFFKYVFWCSLVVILVAVPLAACVAFKGRPKAAGVAGLISFLVGAPVFIYAGVTLVWLFKIALGGSYRIVSVQKFKHGRSVNELAGCCNFQHPP